MINIRPVAYIIGVLLMIVSLMPLVPAAYIVLSGGDLSQNFQAFLAASGIAFVTAIPLVVLNRRANFRLVPRQMYLVTVGSWLIISFFCSIPFVLSGLHLSVVDSVFEAVSGITTTGSTILVGLDKVPRSILIWRALLQWIGGIGIIVMVVAILPHLRVGGMRLFRSEASDKSEKFTSRSSKVASSIGNIYLALTIACTISYWLAGMDGFNAVLHAMTTISTGGYSSSDLSIRQFADSDVVWVSSCFMFLAGLPFVLLVQAVRGKPDVLMGDQQVRGYTYFVISAITIISVWLIFSYDMPIGEAFRIGSFISISIITTTGFSIIDYNLWGGLAVGAFFFMTFVGACAGSTAGGIKIFRFQIAFQMLRNQINAMLHPRGAFPNFFNGRPISSDIVTSVIAFSFVFSGTVAVLAVGLSLTGLDLTTSLSGAATVVANVGPGMGDTIGPVGSFQPLPDSAKWLLIVGMLLGRLEILTFLVVFTAGFWRD